MSDVAIVLPNDTVHCDHCKKPGRRPRMYPCPDGWFYLEATDPEDGTEHTIIMWACSMECAVAQWKPGPGPRWTFEEVMGA